MGMNVGPSSSDGEVMVEINTTPLIDVMLVLLVMLIITIPIQLHTINLDMPPPSSTPPARSPDRRWAWCSRAAVRAPMRISA